MGIEGILRRLASIGELMEYHGHANTILSKELF
jgi:hypothetical protein